MGRRGISIKKVHARKPSAGGGPSPSSAAHFLSVAMVIDLAHCHRALRETEGDVDKALELLVRQQSNPSNACVGKSAVLRDISNADDVSQHELLVASRVDYDLAELVADSEQNNEDLVARACAESIADMADRTTSDAAAEHAEFVVDIDDANDAAIMAQAKEFTLRLEKGGKASDLIAMRETGCDWLADHGRTSRRLSTEAAARKAPCAI